MALKNHIWKKSTVCFMRTMEYLLFNLGNEQGKRAIETEQDNRKIIKNLLWNCWI